MCSWVPTDTRTIWKLIMAIAIGGLILLGFLFFDCSDCDDSPCPDGRLCPSYWSCCEVGCCAPTTAHSRSSDIFKDHGFMDHPWYTQWPVLFFIGILGGILICCMWFCICKRYASDGVLAISCSCCMRSLRTADEIDSAGSLYPPPHYSRCGSIHQAPPPYSEVQSKPDLYPLVITCADGEGKAGGNYVMVQYFQNYVIRPPPGSLSATSTAESLNSSFICNATNEANTIIPPPYSCSNFEEYGVGRTMLRSMSSLMEPPGTALVPSVRPRDFALHTPVRHQRHATNVTENMLNDNMMNDSPERLDLELFECPDPYCIHGCEPKSKTPYHQEPTENPSYEGFGLPPSQSPPALLSEARLTSPQAAQIEIVRKQTEERKQRRLTENIKWNTRKSSLYMPLSTAPPPGRVMRVSPGARAFSMSAPATPCSNLVPNILNITQRVSASRHSSRSSRLEEYDPLLIDIDPPRPDDKF